jgi:hypothetical protein
VRLWEAMQGCEGACVCGRLCKGVRVRASVGGYARVGGCVRLWEAMQGWEGECVGVHVCGAGGGCEGGEG